MGFQEEEKEMGRHRERTKLPTILTSSWYLMTLLIKCASVKNKTSSA